MTSQKTEIYPQSDEKCIPGLYLTQGIEYNCPESEKKVYDAIKEAIPSNWYSWHSIKFRSRKENDIEMENII